MNARKPETTTVSRGVDSLRDNKVCLALVGAFFLFGLVGVVRHEPWGDEVHAWLVAARSGNLAALVNNWQTHGHPLLWNALVYALTRVTADVLWMQVMHLLIATGSAYVFVRFSPFSRLQKSLFIFGYFPFFEYSLISRAYVIGVLCVWIFCALYSTRERTRLFLAVVLAIMANTSVFGAIMSIAFALTLVVDAVMGPRTGERRAMRAADGCAAALVFLAGIAVSVILMMPPAGEGFPAEWRTDLSVFKLGKVLTTVWNSYVPVPDLFTVHFWETNLFSRAYSEYLFVVGPIHAALSVGLLVAGVLALARKPVALFCYVCGTSGILLFEYTKYFGFLRHHGHLFVLFVACWWLARSYAPVAFPVKFVDAASRRIEAFCGTLFTVLLTIHLGVGVYAYVLDLRHPFAASQAVVRALKTEGLETGVNACYPDWLCVSFAYYLDKGLYYPNADRVGTFLVYDRSRRHWLSCAELVQRVRTFADRKHGETLFLTAMRLDCSDRDPGVALIREFHTDTLYAGDSHWYLYRVLPEQIRARSVR